MEDYDFTDFVTGAPHPGERLREDFMPKYKLTAGASAQFWINLQSSHDLSKAAIASKGKVQSDQANRSLAVHRTKMVPGGGFEPPTRGFSIRCSTN